MDQRYNNFGAQNYIRQLTSNSLCISDKLPSDLFKLRGGIYFVDALPRTMSGKIKKHIIKMHAFDLYHESGAKIEDFKF